MVMLAYTVLFFLSAKTHYFLNLVNLCFSRLCCDLCMCVYLFTGIFELDDCDDCIEPTCEC